MHCSRKKMIVVHTECYTTKTMVKKFKIYLCCVFFSRGLTCSSNFMYKMEKKYIFIQFITNYIDS